MSFGNTHQRGVDLGDCVVKDGFQLVTGSVFGNVDVWEILIEAIVSEFNFSRTDGHEPHMKIIKRLHHFEYITPHRCV